MRKFDRPLLALYLGVLIVVLAVILLFSAYSAAQTQTPPECLIYKTGQCPTERPLFATTTSTVEPSTTTTTTIIIDLSFLNSTTTTTIGTTVPKRSQSSTVTVHVPEYRYDHADRWDRLAQCECGGNWSCNTGNGFGGGLQFMHQQSYSTWLSFGGGEYAPHPWEATREQQIDIAERVLASSGWSAWPGCSRRFGWL